MIRMVEEDGHGDFGHSGFASSSARISRRLMTSSQAARASMARGAFSCPSVKMATITLQGRPGDKPGLQEYGRGVGAVD